MSPPENNQGPKVSSSAATPAASALCPLPSALCPLQGAAETPEAQPPTPSLRAKEPCQGNCSFQIPAVRWTHGVGREGEALGSGPDRGAPLRMPTLGISAWSCRWWGKGGSGKVSWPPRSSRSWPSGPGLGSRSDLIRHLGKKVRSLLLCCRKPRTEGHCSHQPCHRACPLSGLLLQCVGAPSAAESLFYSRLVVSLSAEHLSTSE